MRLQFIKDVVGLYTLYKCGDVIEYDNWDYEFRGLTEPERIYKGMFVHCHGQGEFDVLTENCEVVIVPDVTKLRHTGADKEIKITFTGSRVYYYVASITHNLPSNIYSITINGTNFIREGDGSDK